MPASQAALVKLGFFTVAMVAGPIGTYFLSLKHVWGGEPMSDNVVKRTHIDLCHFAARGQSHFSCSFSCRYGQPRRLCVHCQRTQRGCN
jgi:hypothetical protein